MARVLTELLLVSGDPMTVLADLVLSIQHVDSDSDRAESMRS